MAKTHLSIDEFLKTPEWACLSVRQKFWLRSYLECDDPIFAVQTAYPDVAMKNIRAFSYKVRNQKKVQSALNKYFNRSDRDIFLDQLQRDIKRAKGAAKIELQMEFAKLKFGSKPPKKKSKGKSNGAHKRT